MHCLVYSTTIVIQWTVRVNVKVNDLSNMLLRKIFGSHTIFQNCGILDYKAKGKLWENTEFQNGLRFHCRDLKIQNIKIATSLFPLIGTVCSTNKNIQVPTISIQNHIVEDTIQTIYISVTTRGLIWYQSMQSSQVQFVPPPI